MLSFAVLSLPSKASSRPAVSFVSAVQYRPVLGSFFLSIPGGGLLSLLRSELVVVFPLALPAMVQNKTRSIPSAIQFEPSILNVFHFKYVINCSLLNWIPYITTYLSDSNVLYVRIISSHMFKMFNVNYYTEK